MNPRNLLHIPFPKLRPGLVGIILGIFSSTAWSAEEAKPASDTEVIRQTLKEIQGKLPDQAHTMADVAYHFGNLWFAGRAENWPLAGFYVNETKSHLRWAVRVKLERPLSTGGELKLGDLLDAIEKITLKEVEDSVKAGEKPASKRPTKG